MITPLIRTSLDDLLNKPILFDANIFMVGLSKRATNSNYSFENMKDLFIEPLFNSFSDIYIHKEVYEELDKDAKEYINAYIGKNVTIVDENGMYGSDPLYTTIFNNIANHELVKYKRGASKDRGEVYSLAYAAYHNINYFCSKEIMVDNVSRDLEDLNNVDIITFDVVLLNAYKYHYQLNDSSKFKGLKSLYKEYCADVIRRHGLPPTLAGYIKGCHEYL